MCVISGAIIGGIIGASSTAAGATLGTIAMAGLQGAAVGAAIGGAVMSFKTGKDAAKSARKEAKRSLAMSSAIEGMRKEQWDYYKDHYEPISDGLIDRVMPGETLAKVDPSMALGQVNADVNRGHNDLVQTGLAHATNKEMGGTEFKQSLHHAGETTASESARLSTVAELSVEDQRDARAFDILSLGKGLPAQASAGMANVARASLNQSAKFAKIASAAGKDVLGIPAQTMVGYKTGQKWASN